MVERQHHGVIVDDVERVAQLSGIPDAGHLPQVMAMRLQKLDELSRALVGKPEHDAVLDAMFGRVLGDASQNRKSALDGGVDSHEIAGFQVRQNPLAGRRQRYEVPSDVPVDAQRQVEKWMPAACT